MSSENKEELKIKAATTISEKDETLIYFSFVFYSK